jgi:hypothetical protein
MRWNLIILVAISLLNSENVFATSAIGKRVDDFRSTLGSPSYQEILGRTRILRWNNRRMLRDAGIPNVFAVQVGFLDGIACEIVLRSNLSISRENVIRITSQFLDRNQERNAGLERVTSKAFATYELKDGTIVSVNKHNEHVVVVISGTRCIANQDIFDKEAAKVRPPKASH